MKETTKTNGFTLVEVLLVITLLGIALGFMSLFRQTSQLRADLNTQAGIIVSYLRVAQTNALSGNTNQPNSVHLTENSITTFIGSTFIEAAPTNFTINLPPTLAIQNISLNGAQSDIVFTSPKGETNNYGTFKIISSSINKEYTINISKFGTISY